MSVEAWTTIFVIISFILYLYIGWRSRVKDSKGFFVADQGVPAIANGAATAADWMSAASFISMAGLISDSLHNKTVAEIQELDWATKWENTGLLAFEDKNNNGRIELTTDQDSSEITIDRDIIVLSTPEVANLAP
ncbi:MAG: hypothetical protein WBM32_05820 [Crocosphaera sp.]|jgi:Na+(H+)/acetate symporter ActP